MKLYDFVYITNNTSIIKYIKDTIILVENSIYSLIIYILFISI